MNRNWGVKSGKTDKRPIRPRLGLTLLSKYGAAVHRGWCSMARLVRA